MSINLPLLILTPPLGGWGANKTAISPKLTAVKSLSLPAPPLGGWGAWRLFLRCRCVLLGLA